MNSNATMAHIQIMKCFSVKLTIIYPILDKLMIILQYKQCTSPLHRIVMQFTTGIELPVNEIDISHNKSIVFIGSCFAENIGKKLQDRKFNIEVNPFGVQYNPFSVSAVLKRVASGALFTQESREIFSHNGKWHSIMHHSDFSRNTKEELLEHINDRLMEAHTVATRCDVIVVTFGTAYTYTRNSDNMIVGNCHKLPAKDFTRRLSDISTIAEEYDGVIDLFKRMNPGVKFIFTVSPIRHLRDGAHDNQKSKATLLLAIDSIMGKHPDCCHYFPAYEILLDELRDYRFYAEDMTHPSSTAIEYIWECFGKCYFSASTMALNGTIEEVLRGLNHRPFDRESEGYRQFAGNLAHKISALAGKYPFLDFKKELTLCNTLSDK